VQNLHLRSLPVTVGISFHEGEKWFARCIQSVLSQSIWPKELIIIDDGTNPGLDDFLDKYFTPSTGLDIFKIEVSPKLDISEKYNRIIENANQAWVQIIDQDDYLYPNFYFSVEKYLEKCNGVVAGGVRSNIKLMSVIGAVISIFVKDGTRIKRQWPILGSIATRSGLIYNTNICRYNLFPYPTKNGSDIIQLDDMRKSGDLIYVPSALVHYEVHGNSFSRLKSRSQTPEGFLYYLDSQLRYLLSRILR
jgi:glycosyltransferase involved in cell wall biosynthesis